MILEIKMAYISIIRSGSRSSDEENDYKIAVAFEV